jgi:hypothetical protein
MKNNLMGALVIGLGLLVGNLVTNGAYKLYNYSKNDGYEMIQLLPADQRPVFKVNESDFLPNRFPPPVSLHVESDNNNPTGFQCSATVISNEYVLTAAHCLVGENGKMLNSIKIKSMGMDKDGLTSTQDGIPVGINQRADYALIKGDFSMFTKTRIDVSMNTIMNGSGEVVNCGFPWGSNFVCYPIKNIQSCVTSMCVQGGVSFPGMSGGPVVMITEIGPVLFAVNYGVNEYSIVVSPLVGLFESLGVSVEQ